MSFAHAGVRRAISAIQLAWLIACLELVVVLGLAQARLTGVWEAQIGVLWLLPALLLGATLLGLLGGLFWGLLTQPGRSARLALALFAGVAIGIGAWGVGGGRHLAGPGLRPLFATACGAGAGFLLFKLAPFVSRAVARRSPVLLGLVIGLPCLLEVVNQTVLVRLYSAFHVSLTLLTFVLATGVAFWPTGNTNTPAPGVRSRVLVLLVLAASAVGLVPASKRLSGFDNFRLILFESAPSVRYAVSLASWVAPPPPLADCTPGKTCDSTDPSRKGQGKLNLQGRSVLLVTVDALRADHVGAYGYQRNTTPTLDQLAKTSTVFEFAYAATPHTSYSLTSLMTGKYMRPLLLQETGADSATWADMFRTYGYKTAAFYPPAVYFIDGARFTNFQRTALGFEYRKEEFAEGEKRVDHVRSYLSTLDRTAPVFIWVHLFGPHEPYENHAEYPFGERDLDRYDSEIAAADATLGKLVRLMRARDPSTIVTVTADHGEEFGEHGGRYHGTSVYEEQVRVPLVVQIPDQAPPAGSERISVPVQTVDILPTFLELMGIPVPPRVRGQSFAAWLSHPPSPSALGLALAETDEQTLLAESNYRLVCARKVGACALYDVLADPRQVRDLSRTFPQRFDAMRAKLKRLGESHGRFELQGLRTEGKGWPTPILRAIAGDGDVALDVAALLDDADAEIRAKAAEQLFELQRSETAPALRLALRRDESEVVKNWAALALTRLGEGVPLTTELLQDKAPTWRRWSALALAEQGLDSGKGELVSWWLDPGTRDFPRSLQILKALGRLRAQAAVYPLTQSLGDVRLRSEIARTLAAIGDEAAVGPLLTAFTEERYQNTRVALAEALVALKVGPLLGGPLVRFLGVPDPLPNGLQLATEARALEQVGGPSRRELERLRAQGHLGTTLRVTVPRGGNGAGVRVLVRARSRGKQGWIRISSGQGTMKYNSEGKLITSRNLPTLDNETSLELKLPAGSNFTEVYGPLPPGSGAVPGRSTVLIVVASSEVELDAVAVVPLSDELPPPAARAWDPASPN